MDANPQVKFYVSQKHSSKTTNPQVKFFVSQKHSSKTTNPQVKFFVYLKHSSKTTNPQVKFFDYQRHSSKTTNPQVKTFLFQKNWSKEFGISLSLSTGSKKQYFFACFFSNTRKGIVLEVTQQKECLQHVWNWKELRGGEELTLQNYSEMMAKAGESAHNLQEQLAGVKGQLAARAARVSKK